MSNTGSLTIVTGIINITIAILASVVKFTLLIRFRVSCYVHPAARLCRCVAAFDWSGACEAAGGA